jgi:hypothetical protein
MKAATQRLTSMHITRERALPWTWMVASLPAISLAGLQIVAMRSRPPAAPEPKPKANQENDE